MAPPRQTPQQTHDQRIKELEEFRKRQEAKNKEDEVTQARLWKFGRALNDMDMKKGLIEAQTEDFKKAARDIGVAYSLAAKKHKSTLEDQARHDALNDQILFSVLTVAAVGPFSWVCAVVAQRAGKAMAAAQNRLVFAEQHAAQVRGLRASFLHRADLLKNAEDYVKSLKQEASPPLLLWQASVDALQAGGIEGGLGNVAPALAAIKLDERNDDPEVFETELQDHISDLHVLALKAIRLRREEFEQAAKQSPEFWDTYDAEKRWAASIEWQQEFEKLPKSSDLASTREMADEFERGIWQRYILDQRFYRHWGLWKSDEFYDFVGTEVFKRLHELGITREAGISKDITEGAERTEIAGKLTIEPLVKWAHNWKITPVHELKKKKKRSG
jgi:hypothetical protein